jgi:Uncharacterized membrane protein
MLLCVGAASTMLVSQYIYASYGVGDPARLSAQVISGIGFLGAGTIIVTRRNQIKGLTTAATLWATACMGLAVGRQVLRMRLGHVCHFDLYSSFGQCGGHEILKNPHQYSALSGGPAGCRVGKRHTFHPRDRLKRSRGQRIPPPGALTSWQCGWIWNQNMLCAKKSPPWSCLQNKKAYSVWTCDCTAKFKPTSASHSTL